MPEYVVDCEHVAYGDGKTLVLPVSISSHVHERVTRCRDCAYCFKTLWPPADPKLECRVRPYQRHFTEPEGFCHIGMPRAGDG